MKFSGKMWIKIKSHKNKQTNKQTKKNNQGFSLFEKVTIVKIWSKRTLSKISEF